MAENELKVKHTPGPFIADRGTEDEPDRWYVLQDRPGKKFLIATIENGAPGDTLETEGANARLFAAADDLLAYAVCEQAINGDTSAAPFEPVFLAHGYDAKKYRCPGEFLDELRERAIAKAEGR